MSGSVVVSWNFPKDDKDNAILLVGRMNGKRQMEVINAFQGEKAIELLDKIITVRKD